MRLRCALVIRGVSNPFVVLDISNCAEDAGLVVPIPTFWDLDFKQLKKIRKRKIVFFIPADLGIKIQYKVDLSFTRPGDFRKKAIALFPVFVPV